MKIRSISFNENLDVLLVYLYNDITSNDYIEGIKLDDEEHHDYELFPNDGLRPKEEGLLLIRLDNPFHIGSYHKLEISCRHEKINVNVRAFKPVFPIGIYGGNTVLSSRDHIMNVLSWGLDTLVANPDKLDIAKQYDFKIIANVPKKGNEIDEDVLHKYRGHEALLAWYIVDEPDIWEVEGRIPKGSTERWTNTVKKLDPETPTYIVLCRPTIFEQFAHIPDIVAVDPYPVSHLPLEYVDFMVSMIKRIRDPYPIWVIPQAFRYGRPNEQGWWGWNRYPRPDEERLMVYSAIAHGAKGVIYFTYNSFVDIARDPVQGLAALHPDALNLQLEISRISTELHTLAPLISISDVLPYLPEHYVYTNRGCIQCSQILSGRENLVLIITNRNYLYTRRDFRSFPIKDVEICIKPPRWLKPQLSFLISHEGMTTLKMYHEDELVRIKLDELKVAMAIVLSESEEILHKLEEIWRKWRRN